MNRSLSALPSRRHTAGCTQTSIHYCTETAGALGGKYIFYCSAQVFARGQELMGSQSCRGFHGSPGSFGKWLSCSEPHKVQCSSSIHSAMLFQLLLLLVLAKQSEAERAGKPCDYCGLNPANTYCLYSGAGPGTGCGPVLSRGVANQERAQLLETHNRYRSRVSAFYNQSCNALRLIIPAELTLLLEVAEGKEPVLEGVTAAGMVELEWDEELAQGAQLWADRCRFQHDSGGVCRFPVGQVSTVEMWNSHMMNLVP